jgi:hypothetical protein
MDMCVFCLAENSNRASMIVNRLKRLGIEDDGISVVMPNAERDERSANLALVEFGDLAARGPVVGALRRDPPSKRDGLAKALVEIGVPRTDADVCQAGVKAGRVFISVSPHAYEGRRAIEL